ncbi:MAG: cell wall metabolism sensor histidine kinase WalK [Tissierellaceae bacterium]|nr:cell wall metabolism sensor histidine kinase WalK [Tissierellaceae bacterium]
MFSSIKWKFIVVYFLLVFIAMVIVGIFIIGKLETQQIANITNTMEQRIEAIIRSSSYLSEEDWTMVQSDIQETVNNWRTSSNEVLYVIYGDDIPVILASTSKQSHKIIGQNALSYKLDPTLILRAYDGENASGIVKEANENLLENHVVYPVFTEVGKVKGVIYMVADLENVYITVNESKKILTSATLMALLITVFLGYLIASSITEPIRDVTRKAEEMATGNFNQFVEIRSDDEIGQLANMFNHLTLKLKDTIQEMDLERSKLDTIFSYMAEGVIAVGTNGQLIHANLIAVEVLGLKREYIYSKDFSHNQSFPLEMINVEDVDYDDESTLEGEETVEIDNQVYKVKYAPFKNENNDIGGLIIVFQDITKEHKLDNMRKEFVANVSHELKTPITTIKSYTETLMEGGIDKKVSNNFLSVIDNECDRMTRLVRDLLQLSNLDYKKTLWKKEEVSLEKLIKDILLKLELVFKEKEQELIMDIQEDLPDIVVDKDGIEQVILNIVSNSIKYTNNRSKIAVSLGQEEEYLYIKVQDNGAGIPKEDQKRIFERFYRVEKGRSRDLGGTGLGLSIARQIVEAHKGDISLKSTPGEGTIVEVRLPLQVSVIQT